ncbi:MAG TPA: choice-of-anchor B family protein [Bacteroidia bacterium]|nr:choice-of-anchor B family protein [Bacteroidia bacterium]
MKKLLLIFVFLPVLSFSQTYQSQNVIMLGNWNNNPAQPAEPVYGIKYQGVCAWVDTSNNREYGIIGTSTGTEFVDVTNPASPVACDYIPAVHGNLIWHEIKTWHQYCYIVSDDNAPNSFIIADMSYLPDSVHVVRNDNTMFERCHTIFVDGDKLYGGSVTLSNSTLYSMAVWDLSVDPINPPLLRTLNEDYPTINYVHDMFVRNDTVYASCGYQGLQIYKFNSTTNDHFTQLAVLTSYPESGYNHSSFLTQNGRTLIFTDEVPVGKGIKSLDVSDFGNLTINEVFRSHTGNTPHNPYILGNNILVAANYTDGIQIFNISNPSDCIIAGYFDTDTIVNYPNYPQSMAYHGAWGADPFLPSGHVLAADMQNGLFILDISQAILNGTHEISRPEIGFVAYPNPFNTNFYINMNLDRAEQVTYAVYDNIGKLVLQNKMPMPGGTSLLEVPAEGLLPGIYSVKIEGETISRTARLVKTN